MPDVITEAADLIRARLEIIDSERVELEKALSGLGDGQPKGQRSSARSPSKTARRPGRKGSKIAPAGQRRQQLIDYLGKNPGARPSEIAKGMGVTPANVQNVLRRSLADGDVVKKDGRYQLAS